MTHRNRLLATIILIISAFFLLASAQDKPAATNRITSLYDAIGEQKKPMILDWGFSALIEYNGKRILFDAGNDPDNLEQNAKLGGVDLTHLDFVVLSHRHNDHASGFDLIARLDPKVRVYLADDATFWTAPVRLKEEKMKELPEGLPEQEMYFQGREHENVYKATGPFRRMDAVLVEKDVEIEPGLWIVHTTSKVIGDASGYPPNSTDKPSFEGIPELSLAMKTAKGIVLITGCSHSGVEVIVDAVRQLTKQDVDLVYGGFHMQPYDAAYVEQIARRLKDAGVKRIAPAHCTGLTGFKVFRQVFGKDYIYAGLGTVTTFSN